MSNLRVGVVGLGKMGLLHSGIFNQLESSTLVAVAEKDARTGNLLKAYRPNINVYRDYAEMFKREELDVHAVYTAVELDKALEAVLRKQENELREMEVRKRELHELSKQQRFQP